jgi:hypothetical protein
MNHGSGSSVNSPMVVTTAAERPEAQCRRAHRPTGRQLGSPTPRPPKRLDRGVGEHGHRHHRDHRLDVRDEALLAELVGTEHPPHDDESAAA